MLDFAIRKSENALGRILFRLLFSAIAMLGLVWLSIAAAGFLARVMSQPAAAAITGGFFIGVSLFAYAISRAVTSESKSETREADTQSKAEDVTARAIRIAERMAPQSPMVALLVALLSGLGSVLLPSVLNPFLNKILDDVEKFPDVRTTN